MRLTHIEADDFLSFSKLRLDGLDPKLNVIVGPNGAGKSNLVRMVDLVVRALLWASGRAEEGLVREYARAVSRGVQPERFCVRIGVELNQDRERDLLVAWLRMGLFSTFVTTNQSRAEGTDGYLLAAIDRETVEMLCRGSVVVAFRRLPADRFFVGYEFEVDGQTYCYVMRGDQHGGIVRGRLDEQVRRGGSVRGGSTRSSDRLLVDEEIDNSSEQDIRFDFNPGRLLPGEGEFIQLAGQPLFNWQETGTVHEFMRLFGYGVENRGYMLDVVMAPLFAEVIVVNECRGVARHVYGADELATEIASQPTTADVPLELLHLKVGDQAERHRFACIQDFFRELTGVDFDIHLLPESAANDGSAADRLFRIDVDIIDGPMATPLAFSGAGRWEALVLSTALTGESTVTIFDEPAINLHPTLQRRLLSALRQSPSQTLLITHSPFLVPSDGAVEIDRITRLARAGGATVVHRTKLSTTSTPVDQGASKLQRFMMASSDVRALLFADAVLLVEGDTDLGALEVWLPAIAAGSKLPVPDDLNLVIAAAGGDTGFTTYTRYLDAFGIPWTIFCDGKVLSSNYPHTLCKQLPNVSHDGRPADGEVFDAWRKYWASVGVFTLAESFDEEIEAALGRIDATLWSDAKKRYGRSNVRAGRAFAEQTPPPERLGDIYSAMLEHLGLAAAPPP